MFTVLPLFDGKYRHAVMDATSGEWQAAPSSAWPLPRQAQVITEAHQRWWVMVAVVGALVLVLPAALRSVDQQLTALPGVGMLSAACLAVLAAPLRQHHGTLWRVGIAALTIAGVVVMVFHKPDPAPMTAWWPLQIAWLVGAYLALTAHSTAGVVAVSVGVLGIFASASPVPAGLADTEPTRYLILTGVVAATSILTLGLVARGVVDVLSAGERQAAVNRRHVLEAAEERIRLRARTLATRHIHDHVLYTLQLIAMDRRDVPARDVLAEVTRLRGRLRERGTEMPLGADALTDLIETLSQIVTRQLKVTVRHDGSCAVPPDVANAFYGAVREALRNVERHAEVDEATVSISSRGGAVEVAVVDGGVGFSVGHGFRSARREGRLGLSGSIVGRMLAVGGQAHLASAQGLGTRVTLSWSFPPAQGPAVWRHVTHQRLGRTVGLAAIPFTLLAILQSVLTFPYVPHPWIHLITVLALSVLVHVVLLTRRSRVGASCSSVLIVTACLAVSITTWAGGHVWGMETNAGPLLAVAVVLAIIAVRPWADAAIAAAVAVAAIVVSTAATRPLAELPALIPMVLGLLATTAVGLAGWLAAQRIEEQADVVDRALIWSQESAAVEQAAWDQVTRVLRSVPGDPLSLLSGLDDGRLAADDPEVRAQSCLCERGLRAEITATAHVDLSTHLPT